MKEMAEMKSGSPTLPSRKHLRKVARGKNIPVCHIYTFGGAFIFYALIGTPIRGFEDWLVTAVAAAFFAGIAMLIRAVVLFFRGKVHQKNERMKLIFQQGLKAKESGTYHADSQAIKEVKESVQSKESKTDPRLPPVGTGNPELDRIIKEGDGFICELETALANIKQGEIIFETRNIIGLTIKIIHKLHQKPDLIPSAQRFFDYYLPITTKIITNYEYMESQGVPGENISRAMKKIEGTMSQLTQAYQSFLDRLFYQTSMDLETDVMALEMMLKKEGLAKDIAISDFLEQ